jgi:hypothetical protein
LAADREHERAESEADRAMEKIVKGEKWVWLTKETNGLGFIQKQALDRSI